MRDKCASLSVDGERYLYSIKALADAVKIAVYRSSEKVPVFTAYVSYVEAWGFDVYRPRMIEILIRYYLRKSDTLTERKLVIREHPELFAVLLDCFFADSKEEERENFAAKCKVRW